jgi:uncharacterized protein YcsI (UPF0317 family)
VERVRSQLLASFAAPAAPSVYKPAIDLVYRISVRAAAAGTAASDRATGSLLSLRAKRSNLEHVARGCLASLAMTGIETAPVLAGEKAMSRMSAAPLQSTVDWDRSDPRAARLAIRSGRYTGYTAGVAPGFVQANVCILPRQWAEDFLLYCQRNPRPCPLLARSEVGDPRLPTLAEDLDIRTDIPRYQVFRDGKLVEEVTDIARLWRDDLVTFALGCSFSFEEALLAAGLRLKFFERDSVAGVYVTNVETVPAGPFRGPLMVTMRAFKPAEAIRAVQITSRFPSVHGAPVHIGRPQDIGIDLARRYQNVGDGEVAEDELPVFWACGLTPQLAVQNAKPPLCITHAPSSMLITDLRNASLAAL